MKHLTKSRAPGISTGPILTLLRAALLVLIFGMADTALSAQCSLDCRGSSPGASLSVVIDEDCEVTMDTSLLLEPYSTCPGDKLITVRDSLSNIIVADTNEVSFDAVPYQGQLLRVTIKDLASNLFCNSFVRLADVFPPMIYCASDTVSCLVDTSVASIGYPIITDNCFGDVAVRYVDTMMSFPCQGPDVALLERTWTATDMSGNIAECIQAIHLDRPALEDITFPPDTMLTCDGSPPNPEIAGWPTLNGDTLFNNNACFLSVFFEDDTLSSCSEQTFDLLRTWTVYEACSGLESTEIQLISVVDTLAPQITCPPAVTAAASPGACYARVTLPVADITDNCDDGATFFVNTSYGEVGLGPHSYVPIGTHTLQYTAIDACQNTRTCSTILNVVDQEPPVAVCNESAVVSIPSGGYGTANATTFDEGSLDNCANTLYFKARRVDSGGCQMANGDDSGLPGYQEWFDGQVRFCCEDIGEEVEVILHVYEIDPGSGPVDPSRTLPNGDLYGRFSECRALVEVQDVLDPRITCPHDTVINCTTDYSDLSIFGNPDASDNCGAQVAVREELEISNCGTGTISRTFKAIDPSGNNASCTQVITVVKDAFTEDRIIWPENYTIDICGAATDPEDLPPGFARPQVVDTNCTNITVFYEDDLFNIAAPACYKILRRWTVVDGCDYNPDAPGEGGRFSKVQIIKVEDNNAPILDCPVDITRGVSDDCSGATVSLPPVTAVDCNSNLIITNDSPFATSGGANATGDYPMGTTVVTFSATDRCGNLSTCEVNISVADDRPPSPVCIVGLSINLSDSDGDGQAILQAASFDGGSTDNCTSSEDLRRTLRLAGTGTSGTPPSTTELAFTCADRGNQMVEFWVTDAVGNSDYCVTVIAVQDNNGVCPQQVAGMIAGGIQTETGEYVDNVMVNSSGGGNMQGLTEEFGLFEILGVPFGGDYSLTAQRNDGPLNGVSTLDLVLVSQHILGLRTLDSPYKQIAADINRSGSVSTLDMIGLRKMILGLDSAFPNGNTSWRFVDARFEFPEAQDAFAVPFPEVININNFSQDEMEANFIAIKVGDVDDSAVPNSLLGVDGRTATGTFTLRLPEQRAQAGELITVPVRADQLDKMLGYQFSLGFDPADLEWISLEAGALPGLSSENFNLQMVAEGRISTSWHWPAEASVEATENVLLFNLVFRARRAVKTLQPLFFVGSDPTPAEAYDADGGLLNIRLEVEDLPQERVEQLELYQNRPNPFTSETAIGFRLPRSGSARLKVIDLSGKLIYQREDYFERGYNEITISAADLPVSGILYYQLETATKALTKKMILM